MVKTLEQRLKNGLMAGLTALTMIVPYGCQDTTVYHPEGDTDIVDYADGDEVEYEVELDGDIEFDTEVDNITEEFDFEPEMEEIEKDVLDIEDSCQNYLSFCRDADNDTYGTPLDMKTICENDTSPEGYVLCDNNNIDCNDHNKDINPGIEVVLSPSICEINSDNYVDLNCDDEVDNSCMVDIDQDGLQFAGDIFETTNRMYADFLNSGDYDTHFNESMRIFFDENEGKYVPVPGHENKPVSFVNLYDAKAFCESVGKQVPEVPEWLAMAGGADNRYPWGYDEPQPCVHANYNNCLGSLADVGSYSAGDSIWGIKDLAGNDQEWTDTDSEDGSGKKVVKGGSYKSDSIILLNNEKKNLLPNLSGDSLGFRCFRWYSE